MQDFQWMLEYGINRFGSLAALEARLPIPAAAAQLTAVSDERYLSKQGYQLGGLSAPRFLRMAGKDTFVLSTDVVAALVAQDIVTKNPTSQRDLSAVQEAFNIWQTQSGRPLCQISMLLALTVNH